MTLTSTHRPLTLIAVFVTALSALVWGAATPVQAAASISVSASASASVLAGDSVDYTVGVTNSGDEVQYNISATATLAPDVVYDPGSTSPAAYGNPTVTTNATTGVTTLIWSNVSDLQIADSLSLEFTATPKTASSVPPAVFATYPVGANVPFSAAAFGNTDPRTVPRFTATGAPIASTYTQTDSATSLPTAITAITIDKSEPSPEGELLRGIHDQTTVYTLDVNVTDEDGVNGIIVVDMLPAQLEFLGCGGVDFGAPEFPGAPSLIGTPAVGANCLTPTTVTTVLDPVPDGTTVYPPGVYTRIVWDLGDLPAGANRVIQYAAGIPLRANTMDFGGPTPPNTFPFGQQANLDNNVTGAPTRETTPETSIANRSRVSGIYLGAVQAPATQAVFDKSTEFVYVEDLRIRKSVTPGTFSAGGIATYAVTIDTSEYVSVANPVLTDTISNGLCPLDNVANYASGSPPAAECDPIASGPTVTDGATTQPLPYTSVLEDLTNGGFTMVFSATGPIPPSSSLTVTYEARMRSQYQNGTPNGRPTVAGDSFRNDVDIDATSTPIPDTGETGSQPVGDDSSAGQSTLSQSIDKRVKPRVVGEACNANTGAYTNPPPPLDLTQFGFRLGDEVCFRLTVNYASGVFNKNPVITDFLPQGVTYTDGSMVALPSNNVAFTFNETQAAADTENPIWRVGAVFGSDRYVLPGGVFDVVFSGTVNAIPSATPDITGNLMKMVVENTPGQTSSFRDETPFAIVPSVPLTLAKTVSAVDNPAYSPPPVQATPVVQSGSMATYRIDVTHAGSATNGTNYSVRGLKVYDVLPQPLRCADVSALSNPPYAACYDSGTLGHPSIAGDTTRSVIVWDFVVNPSAPDSEAITLGNTKTLSYNVTWPVGIGTGVTFTNTAGIVKFESFTNEPNVGSTYFPASNIDASVPAISWNAPAASDPAAVRTRAIANPTKLFTSPILSGNTGPATPGTSGQAVIGEVVTYYYGVTIPAGTSIYSGRLTDTFTTAGWAIAASPVPSFTFEADAVGASGTVSPPPANVVLNTTTGQLDFGVGSPNNRYSNTSSTDQRFVVTVTARAVGNGIAGSPTPPPATNRTNTARFQAGTVAGGSTSAVNVSQARNVSLIQPTPSLTKLNNTGGAFVAGGDTVRYTLTASQPNGRPTLYDAWIVDCLPTGITFAGNVTATTQLGAGAQAPTPFAILGPNAGPVDGCAAGTTRVAWNIGSLPQNTTVRVSYDVTVNLTAVAGDLYANTAVLTGSSLNDGNRTTPGVPPNPLERVYTATAPANTIEVAGSAPSKVVDKSTATIGETVTYTVTAPIGANTNFYQVALVDTLPAGIDRSSINLVSATCSYSLVPIPCPGISGSLWAPGTGPGGDVVVFYGDIAADPAARRLTAVYSAAVSDVPGNTGGTPLNNSVNVRWDVTNETDPTALPYTWDRPLVATPASALVTVVQPTLVTSKGVSDPAPALTDAFTYTVTLRNTGSNLSNAYNMVVVDLVPEGIVPGTISNGGTFNSSTREITWDAADLPGPLAPNATLNLTYTATFDATVDGTNSLEFVGDAALVNTVDNDSYATLPSGGRTRIGNSAVANVEADFPTVTLSKSVLSAPPAYIGGAVTWQISGSNTGPGTAASVDVTDVLPPNWDFVAGTSSVTVGANPPVVTNPNVSGPATARRLEWNIGSLLPSQSFTITFQARPSASVVSSPGVGRTIPHTNTVNAAVVDLTGASGNAERRYDPPPASAATRIDAVDVQITSTTPATAIAGTPHTWTLTVSNNGADVAVGPFTVTDVVPPGTSFVSATGTDWTCSHDGSPTGGVVTCVRTNSNDTLAASGPAATFPPISMTVSIGSNTPANTVYTDDAEVTLRTFDTNVANNTDDASTTVTTEADLRVVKSHTDSGVAGTLVNWTVAVDNVLGPSTSRASIVTVDTLPAGVSFVGFQLVDPDLSCTHDGAPTGGDITCTRSTDMPRGAADTFTFTALINRDQIADVTNTVVVTPTTFDPTTPNTASDVVDVTTSADLAVEKAILGTVEAGSVGQYRITVNNVIGPSDAGAFSFTDTLPPGVTVTGIAVNTGGATCGAFPATGAVTCTYAGGIDVGQTFTLTFDVTVAPDVVGSITNTADLNPGVTPDPNPANDTATVVSGVNVDADLSILKTGPTTVTAGTAISWTLTIGNNGPSDDPATITVSDTLPSEVVFDSPVGDLSGEWTCVHDGSPVGGVLTCTNPNGLAAGESQVLTVNADLRPGAGPTSASNTATVSSPTTDSNSTNNQSTSYFDVVDDVEVSVVKTTTGANPVRAGETTSFSLEVRNDGPSTADNIVVTDFAQAGMTILSFSAPPGWTCLPATGVCAVATLMPSTTATITVDVAVASNVADGSTLTNTATVSTTSPGDLPAGNSSSSSVAVAARADLAITKTHDAGPVRAGENTTFTFSVNNVMGPSDAAADVEIDDVLPLGFTYLGATGPWACVPGDPNAPGGQPVTCTYVAAGVPVPLPADATAADLVMTVSTSSALLPSMARNTASVDSPTVDPNSGNDSSFVDVTIVTETDLTITKTVAVSPVVIGDEVTWTVVVENEGPSDAFDVTVDDSVPASVSGVTVDDDADWACTVTGNDVSCIHVGALVALDSASFTVTGTVTAAAFPELVNSAVVSTTTPEPDTDDNTATSTTPVAVQSDLAITKTHVGRPQVGGQVIYTLTVTNSGPTENTGRVVVTDVLPAGLAFVSAEGSGWSCGLVATTVTCTLAGTLAVGATSTVTLVADVEPSAWPSVTNVASVSSPHTDLDPDNNTATDPTPVDPLIALGFEKTVGIIADGVAPWFLRVLNNGPNATVDTLQIVDTLPANLQYRSFAGASWTCQAAGQVVTCVNNDVLAVGQSSQLTIFTTVLAAPGETVSNSATLTGGGSETTLDSSSSVTVPAVPPVTTTPPPPTGLPATGGDSTSVVNLAFMLLGAGLLFLVFSRGRRRTALT